MAAVAAPRQLPYVACCECGVPTLPNRAGMCATCLRGTRDITAKLSKQIVIRRCKECLRWEKPPFVHCDIESKELLALCLKRIRGLDAVRIADAFFIWTEPNSKRLKIRLKLVQDLGDGAVIQQMVQVDVIIATLQCDACKRTYTPHTWDASVQVRQQVGHKRTLLHLEQLILKHDAHDKVINIEEAPNGLDFQFSCRAHAESFMGFIESTFPTQKTTAKQLVSHDANNNTYFHKFAYKIVLPPICTDDIVYLNKKFRTAYGGPSQIAVCGRVAYTVTLIDPVTGRRIDVPNEKYWIYNPKPILTRRNAVEFVVLDIQDHDVCGIPTIGGRAVTRNVGKGRKRPMHGSTGMMVDEDSIAVAAPQLDDEGFRLKPDDAATAAMRIYPPRAVSGSKGCKATRVSLNQHHPATPTGLQSQQSTATRCGGGMARGAHGGRSCKLFRIEVARSSDLGQNDRRYSAVIFNKSATDPQQHQLGVNNNGAAVEYDTDTAAAGFGLRCPVRVGDYCSGYILENITTVNDPDEDIDLDRLTESLPFEVLIVRKVLPPHKRGRRRRWMLQSLGKTAQDEKPVKDTAMPGVPQSAPCKVHSEAVVKGSRHQGRPVGGVGRCAQQSAVDGEGDADLEEFMDALSTDPELRKNVNIWKAPRAGSASDGSSSEEEDSEVDGTEIRLSEMLDGLTLDDQVVPLPGCNQTPVCDT